MVEQDSMQALQNDLDANRLLPSQYSGQDESCVEKDFLRSIAEEPSSTPLSPLSPEVSYGRGNDIESINLGEGPPPRAVAATAAAAAAKRAQSAVDMAVAAQGGRPLNQRASCDTCDVLLLGNPSADDEDGGGGRLISVDLWNPSQQTVYERVRSAVEAALPSNPSVDITDALGAPINSNADLCKAIVAIERMPLRATPAISYASSETEAALSRGIQELHGLHTEVFGDRLTAIEHAAESAAKCTDYWNKELQALNIHGVAVRLTTMEQRVELIMSEIAHERSLRENVIAEFAKKLETVVALVDQVIGDTTARVMEQNLPPVLALPVKEEEEIDNDEQLSDESPTIRTPPVAVGNRAPFPDMLGRATQDPSMWEVLSPAPVLAEKLPSAEVLKTKRQGLRVRGVEDQGWVRLTDEPGYIMPFANGTQSNDVLRRVVEDDSFFLENDVNVAQRQAADDIAVLFGQTASRLERLESDISSEIKMLNDRLDVMRSARATDSKVLDDQGIQLRAQGDELKSQGECITSAIEAVLQWIGESETSGFAAVVERLAACTGEDSSRSHGGDEPAVSTREMLKQDVAAAATALGTIKDRLETRLGSPARNGETGSTTAAGTATAPLTVASLSKQIEQLKIKSMGTSVASLSGGIAVPALSALTGNIAAPLSGTSSAANSFSGSKASIYHTMVPFSTTSSGQASLSAPPPSINSAATSPLPASGGYTGQALPSPQTVKAVSAPSSSGSLTPARAVTPPVSKPLIRMPQAPPSPSLIRSSAAVSINNSASGGYPSAASRSVSPASVSSRTSSQGAPVQRRVQSSSPGANRNVHRVVRPNQYVQASPPPAGAGQPTRVTSPVRSLSPSASGGIYTQPGGAQSTNLRLKSSSPARYKSPTPGSGSSLLSRRSSQGVEQSAAGGTTTNVSKVVTSVQKSTTSPLRATEKVSGVKRERAPARPFRRLVSQSIGLDLTDQGS